MAENQLTIPQFAEQFPENICKVCGQEHRCVICGDPFTPRMHNSNRPQVTCGKEACQREQFRRKMEAYREAHRVKYADQACSECGNTFTPRDPRQKTCAKPECIEKNRQRWVDEHDRHVHRDPAICKYCGDVFTPFGKRSDHCTKPECITKFETESARRTRKKRRDALPPKPKRLCEVCADEYTPTKSDQQVCSKPECQKELYRRHAKEKYDANKKERNKQTREYYARQKARLAEAERLLGLRSPDEIIEAARVTVAAGLQIQGLSKRAMRNDLFPKQHDEDRRYDDTKQFFRRKQDLIEIEIARLKGLSEEDREAAITTARSHL